MERSSPPRQGRHRYQPLILFAGRLRPPQEACVAARVPLRLVTNRMAKTRYHGEPLDWQKAFDEVLAAQKQKWARGVPP